MVLPILAPVPSRESQCLKTNMRNIVSLFLVERFSFDITSRIRRVFRCPQFRPSSGCIAVPPPGFCSWYLSHNTLTLAPLAEQEEPFMPSLSNFKLLQ